ncbi:MAG: hypothetical protein PHR45_00490 [Muribaculaceae bacterium]|nr:hypothetical protein [Muribaculaceae bacterium]
MEEIFTSTEFYIIAFTIAVAITALFFKPTPKDEAATYFFRADMSQSDISERKIEISALEDGTLTITHHGLTAPYGTESSIAITIIGNDIKIVEKLLHEYSDDLPLQSATYIIDRLKHHSYHLYFESEYDGTYATGRFINTYPFHCSLQFTQ